jgi:antitoxin HicB
MPDNYRIPLILEPQPEGGYTVTSPLLPELITEGDTQDEAIENAWDALQALRDAYEYLGRPFPLDLPRMLRRDAVHFDHRATA